jgi:hypothetical protein
MNPKFFTIEEAESLIGFLEATFERVRRNKQQYLWLQQELAILRVIVECGADENNPDAVEFRQKQKRFQKVADEIEKDVAAVVETGCILRDAEKGIVDFYSIQNGEVVFLCWKRGEEAIQYWHPTDAGFEDRRPLVRTPSK